MIYRVSYIRVEIKYFSTREATDWYNHGIGADWKGDEDENLIFAAKTIFVCRPSLPNIYLVTIEITFISHVNFGVCDLEHAEKEAYIHRRTRQRQEKGKWTLEDYIICSLGVEDSRTWSRWLLEIARIYTSPTGNPTLITLPKAIPTSMLPQQKNSIH